MKFTTPEISWHGRDPIYSIDFQYIKGSIQRLATCGTDRHIRVWEVKEDSHGKSQIEFLSTLIRHTRTVNVVRFSPDGEVLASGGDDSVVMLWKLNPMPPSGCNIFQEEDAENRENWSVFKVLRSHLEDVYDVCWSSCGKFMISGSVDNSAILWDVKKGVRLGIFPDHKSFVQGVAFDPLTQYLATMSCDRSCRIYSFETKNCLHTVSKVVFPNSGNSEDSKEKVLKLFHDDNMKSFFRRLCFTPDGQLLIIPAGCIEKGPGEEPDHTTYLFSRNNFTKPVMHLPGPSKPTLAVRCCPVVYELRKTPRKTPLAESKQQEPSTAKIDSDSSNNSEDLKDWQKYETMFCLPYRVVFAVATEDSIILYDTQQPQPFAFLSNIHYHTISDIAWSGDGRYLVVSSTDGYCTLITFQDGELGTPIKDQPVHIFTEAEIKQRQKEKQAKLDLKKKSKSDKKKDNVESSEKVAVSSTTEMDTSEGASSKKEVSTDPEGDKDYCVRRMDTTVLTKSPSTSRRVQLTAVSSSPQTSDPASDSNLVKTPRRVNLSTLTTASTSQQDNVTTSLSAVGKAATGAPESQTPSRREEKKPRRIGVTTLTSFSDKSNSTLEPASTDRGEESLHLVLETTCDATTLPPTSKLPQTGSSSSNSTPSKASTKELMKSGEGTPKSSVSTPRRIKPVTLEAGSPKVSAVTQQQSSSSPQPRRVPLKVITSSKN